MHTRYRFRHRRDTQKCLKTHACVRKTPRILSFELNNKTKHNVVESSEWLVRKRYGATTVDRRRIARKRRRIFFRFDWRARLPMPFTRTSIIGADKCFVCPQTNAIGPRRWAGGNSRKRTAIVNGVKSSSASAVHNLIPKLTFTRPARFSLNCMALTARPRSWLDPADRTKRSRDNGIPEPMRIDVVENICECRPSIENFDVYFCIRLRTQNYWHVYFE